MNKNKKIYAVYGHKDVYYYSSNGKTRNYDYLILIKVFFDKEDAKNYLIYRVKDGIYYSAIIEHNEKDIIDDTLPLKQANFITTENGNVYLIYDGKKELIKKR